MKVEDWDHPLMFLFVMTLGVFAMGGLISWGLSSVNLTGPLSLFKGGVVQTS
jgi:hypothetical protein